ncbi:hypothetical protein HGRIS_009516 [Hohenbuehelia grisea]|uniref:F-box domain-containing protein n=1 Tax=Hohenbuehelia grisea TaxID=104357 RepID=A0ABR3J1E6_9AGAR
MAGHDEICLICSISPGKGPRSLTYHGHAANLAEEILALRPDLTMDATEIASIVAAALELDWDKYSDVGLPEVEGVEGLWSGYWDGFYRVVLIGHWKDGDHVGEWVRRLVSNVGGTSYIHDDRRFPTGVDVAVLRGATVDGSSFYEAEHSQTFDEQYGQGSTLAASNAFYPAGLYNRADPENPTVLLSMCCFYYLQHWIDFERLPPPCTLPSGDTLSLPGELYEIVNSRSEQQFNTLPCIDYDGIDGTLEQWQDFFERARRGVKNVAQAISSGLRGEDLIPALRQDYRCWAFMRTDIWPLPSMAGMAESVYAAHILKETAAPQPRWQLNALPNDILFEIFDQIPIPSFLALASTCRSLRARLLSPDVADSFFKHLVYAGELRWILPVPGAPEEDEHAEDAAIRWLAHVGSS